MVMLSTNIINFLFFLDASGIDFRAMLKKKQHAKQNNEEEPEFPDLKPVEEPVVELKKVEKVGAEVGVRLPLLYRDKAPEKFQSLVEEYGKYVDFLNYYI